MQRRRAAASGFASGIGNTAILVGGGGGGGGFVSPGPQSLLANLNVEGEQRRSSYEATRTSQQWIAALESLRTFLSNS